MLILRQKLQKTVTSIGNSGLREYNADVNIVIEVQLNDMIAMTD